MIPGPMRRRDLLSTALLASTGSLMAFERGPLERASGLLESQVENGTLEAATLVVRQGEQSYRRAFGKAAAPDTVFLIASISKPMTATGVLLLADRGELKLSDPVYKFLPEFSAGDRKRITIERLLTHTSGLPDQLPENAELRKAHAPLSEFVARAVKTPLLFKPGERYKYQSMGLLLAAEIAQRITGKRFRDFLREEVFKPLGMNSTVMGLAPLKLDQVMRSQVEFAAPESGAGAPETRDWDWNSPYCRDLGAPWGGAHSTGPDIKRFLRSFLEPDGRVLQPKTARLMIRNHTVGLEAARGLGFQLGEGFARGCSAGTFGHGGSTGTLCWADPERGLSAVILTTLPSRVSKELLLNPVSDWVSESA